MQVKQLIHKMLTTNTGRAICDSGDAYGRNWERNQAKSIEDFENAPSATLEVSRWEHDGKVSYDASVTIDLYHHLLRVLDLDSICDEFNSMPVEDWRGDIHGTSEAGETWLKEKGFTTKGNTFNTYNWSANFSQTLQGCHLEWLNGDIYLLLQVHQGCDVRGGYTDAKLFKVESEYHISDENCGFYVQSEDGREISLSWLGEFTNSEGSFDVEDDLKAIYEITGGKVIAGDLYEVCY
jgi:hypothetical protein